MLFVSNFWVFCLWLILAFFFFSVVLLEITLLSSNPLPFHTRILLLVVSRDELSGHRFLELACWLWWQLDEEGWQGDVWGSPLRGLPRLPSDIFDKSYDLELYK